jgi:hypothetical protein
LKRTGLPSKNPNSKRNIKSFYRHLAKKTREKERKTSEIERICFLDGCGLVCKWSYINLIYGIAISTQCKRVLTQKEAKSYEVSTFG